MKRVKRIFSRPDQHFPVQGKFKGLIYYVRGDKQCVRTQGNMDGKRFWSDPRFEPSRLACYEFTAASNLSTAIRHGMGDAARHVGGSGLHRRLTKELLIRFRNSPGRRGERRLLLPDNLWKLQSYNLRKKNVKWMYHYGGLRNSLDPVSNRARIHFQFFGGRMSPVVYPEGITHVRPVLFLIGISDWEFDGSVQKYMPVNELNGMTRVVHEEFVPVERLNDRLPEYSWRPDLIFPEANDGACGLLAIVGLEFARLGPEGELYNSFFGSLEVVWGGKVMAEAQVRRIFEESAAVRAAARALPPVVYAGGSFPDLPEPNLSIEMPASNPGGVRDG